MKYYSIILVFLIIMVFVYIRHIPSREECSLEGYMGHKYDVEAYGIPGYPEYFCFLGYDVKPEPTKKPKKGASLKQGTQDETEETSDELSQSAWMDIQQKQSPPKPASMKALQSLTKMSAMKAYTLQDRQLLNFPEMLDMLDKCSKKVDCHGINITGEELHHIPSFEHWIVRDDLKDKMKGVCIKKEHVPHDVNVHLKGIFGAFHKIPFEHDIRFLPVNSIVACFDKDSDTYIDSTKDNLFMYVKPEGKGELRRIDNDKYDKYLTKRTEITLVNCKDVHIGPPYGMEFD